MTHGSPQPSWQKPKTEMESSRKDMWRGVLSYGRNPHNEQRRLTRILPETAIPAEHHHLRLKGTRADKMKEDKQTKILQTGNRLIKILRCRYTLPFLKRKDDSKGRVLNSESGASDLRAKSNRVLFPGLEIEYTFFPIGFQNCLVPVTPLFSSFYHLWGRNVCNCYPVPSLYLKCR